MIHAETLHVVGGDSIMQDEVGDRTHVDLGGGDL